MLNSESTQKSQISVVEYIKNEEERCKEREGVRCSILAWLSMEAQRDAEGEGVRCSTLVCPSKTLEILAKPSRSKEHQANPSKT